MFPTLLRGLKDPVEKVREKCATLVTEYVARLDDAAPALKSLMPALAAVVGVHPVEEPSEEIRLMLVELARAAARKSGVGMTPFVEEFVAVVVVGARDQFHDVKKAVCAAIRTVAGPGGVPRDVLSPRVKTILAAILPDCQHRHCAGSTRGALGGVRALPRRDAPRRRRHARAGRAPAVRGSNPRGSRGVPRGARGLAHG